MNKRQKSDPKRQNHVRIRWDQLLELRRICKDELKAATPGKLVSDAIAFWLARRTSA